MQSKHRKTLQDIFSDPVRGNLVWSRIESLLMALGAEKNEGNGSAVTLRYRVKAVRELLTKTGFKS